VISVALIEFGPEVLADRKRHISVGLRDLTGDFAVVVPPSRHCDPLSSAWVTRKGPALGAAVDRVAAGRRCHCVVAVASGLGHVGPSTPFSSMVPGSATGLPGAGPPSSTSNPVPRRLDPLEREPATSRMASTPAHARSQRRAVVARLRRALEVPSSGLARPAEIERTSGPVAG
jgi:hypothetical protein